MEYLLWAYLIAWPMYIYFTHEQEKQRVIAQPEKRISAYLATMLHLWLPTIMLFALVYSDELSMHDIGLKWSWELANQIGVVGIILLCIYLVLSIKKLKEQTDDHQAIREQFAYIKWFLPRTVKESRYFIFGVSVSAGICEELLYRGYLIQLLAGYMPTYGAVILSSFAFGLGHLYQGPIHILRTALLGVVMALIYLVTDSIIIPILLHTVIDMYSGALAYIVLNKEVFKTDAEEICSENA